MNVGEVIVDYLEAAGVETAFGGSGQSDSDILFALKESKKIKTVIIRNEQAASFMACGYGMFRSDKLGVCFSTAGPGAVNMLSGLCVAYSDSLPVLAMSAYTPKAYRGKGDLGETSGEHRTPNGQQIFSAATKKSFVLERVEDTCDIMEEAINLAFEGRPGPVNLHFDYSIMREDVTNYRPLKLEIAPVAALEKTIEQFADALASDLNAGKKMLALLGYGCVRSQAEPELLALLERYQIPFMTTMDAKGVLPENHPLCVGMTGVSGDPGAKQYLKDADTVLAIGNSFAKWSTWMFRKDLFDKKTLMQINIDKKDMGKTYKPDYTMVSDAKPAVAALLDALEKRNPSPCVTMPENVERHAQAIIAYDGDKVHPGMLVQEISRLSPDRSIILGDAGAHMLWLHAFLSLERGQIYQNPGSFGPMAANVNASMGVQCACPDRQVIMACGDGDYQMAGFELVTAVENNIPVVWIIFNNGEFNVIKMFQLRVREAEVYNHFLNPDYVKYAEACGAAGYRVEKIEDFEPAFRAALALGKPALIDVVVDGEVYPPFQAFDDITPYDDTKA